METKAQNLKSQQVLRPWEHMTLNNEDIKSNNYVTKALNSVNWDFNDAPANFGIHSIHPYPAKFIPQIPRKLIDLFHPGDSSIVLDPFCGSGTTLVEAINLGIDACGIDINPLACQITRVKATPLISGINETAKQIIYKAQERLARNAVQVPKIPRLDHWFKNDIQKALSALIEQINKQKQISFKEALQIALSSIIVQVSNQESDTRYAAIEKNISAQDVFNRFEKAVAAINRAVSTLSDNFFKPLGKANVLNRDILTVKAEDLPSGIGLVVTSPPYPNAYEYWLYHKYRMYWLGMNPVDVCQHEIGARPHYFKVNPQDERVFERQMSTTFRLLAQVMNQKAKACFLIGRSVIHGRVIDNAALLRRAAEPHGFVVEGNKKRSILATRKAFNPIHGKIKEENLIVFSLEKK